MPRPIDADVLLQKECCGRISGADVRNAPTLDYAPVVRCKECSWFNAVFYACDKHGICKPLDWFCADGRKREPPKEE